MEVIDTLEENTEDKSWIKRELETLKKETTLLTIIVFSTLGVLVGYYMFSGGSSTVFTNVSYAGNNSNIVISWETKVPAKTKVEYGTSQDYLNEAMVESEYETMHKISVNGILPDKEHYFRLVAEDASGKTHTSQFYKLN